jgi:hypothetical protein
MSETAQIVIGILIMLVVIVLTRRFHAWKIKKAYLSIVEDLKSKGAFDANSAVDLPYARRNLLRVGLKDHRPTALKSLVLDKIVGISEDGKYYLLDRTL